MPKFRLVYTIAWLLLCGLCCESPGATNSNSASAADGGSFIVDVFEEGLPQSSVIALTQTHDGYLWLGTLNGLARFDGVKFTVFDEANTPELNSSRIVHLFEDSRTNLWLGTETAGVSLVRDGTVVNLGIGQGAREGRLMSACEDDAGAVWLYTADGQLCRYRNGQIEVRRLGVELPSVCRVVVNEENGPLWVGTDYSLFSVQMDDSSGTNHLSISQFPMKVDFLLAGKSGGCWRLSDGRIQFTRTNRVVRDYGSYPWRSDIQVGSACEDENGNLIVGTLGAGVFWFSNDGNFSRISKTNGLSSDWALSLCMDREGSLWVGTDGGGLDRVKRSFFQVVPGTGDSVVQSACEDGDGGLWIGLNGGGAIHRTPDRTEKFGYNEGLLNLNVWSVFVDDRQRAWAGTWFGLHLFDADSSRFFPVEAIGQRVLAIHQDRGGRLWFGTQNGLLCSDEREWKTYTKADGLSAGAVRAIADDAEGNIWIGTEGGGLNLLSGGKFISFRKAENGLPSDDISSLYVDGDGVLWIGTFGSGLARYQNGKWTRYSTKEGLVSNAIGYVIEDGDGYFWIGSTAGLMRVPKKSLNDFASGAIDFITCRLYGKLDGVGECTQGSQPGALRGQDGKLWFPTTTGLFSVDATVLKPNSNPPPVVIESVFVEGRSQITNALRTSLPSEIVVPPRKEQLEIHYTSLNLAAADRARFSYWMEGHETSWTEAGESRVVRYSKLPPGNYVFHVKAVNEDGVGDPAGATLAITVLPPFWRTWWFLTGVTIFILGALAGAVYVIATEKLQREVQQLKQKEALERDRARIARDLHDQLGASLTQVALLGEMVETDKNEPVEVEAYGKQISKTARETTHVLDEIVWAVNPSNDTLDGLVTYFCKYAQDYLSVAGIRYRLDVPGELPATSIAPEVRHNVFLVVKEAVTNVVRHANASEVWVRMRLETGGFALEIQDNGRGVDLEKPQTRNGLRNMRKRMEDVGGSFSINPASGGGTIVKLTAPIKGS